MGMLDDIKMPTFLPPRIVSDWPIYNQRKAKDAPIQKAPIVIFTDGSCAARKQDNDFAGGWGWARYVKVSANKIVEVACGYQGAVESTVNAMELTAAIEALKSLREHPFYKTHPIFIHTDSQYVQKSVDVYIHNWNKTGALLENNTPRPNRKLWIEFVKLLNECHVTMVKVKGHSGSPGNDRADELAGQGRQEALAAKTLMTGGKKNV